MKKTNWINTIGVLALFSANTLFAQERIQQQSGSATSQNENILLNGFDETATISKLKAKGISESEINSYIKNKKKVFFNKQNGIIEEQSVFFSDQKTPVGPCDNAGFEDGTFTNWNGATGSCAGMPATPPTWLPGFVTNRHTINSAAGFDPLAINTVTLLPEIPLIAPGGLTTSVRLGNSLTGAETEYLRYPISVTASNTSFTYQYAVVLENPGSHSADEQPRFDITVFDASGTPVSGPCGVYSVEGLGASSDTTFKPYGSDPFSGLPIGYYKKWTTVSIDLTPYIGTTVTIQFQTSDCTLTGHYGYAYIDASCSQLAASVAFCPNDTLLLLTAPDGFNSYQWYDALGVIIPSSAGGTNDTLFITNPVLGQVYSVSMLSASGCGTSLTVTLAYSDILVNTSVFNVSCYGDSDGYAFSVASGAIPPFTFVWVDSASGGVVGTNNDSLLNVPAGTYFVTVSSLGGCSRVDTLVVNQPPNPSDTLGLGTTFCPGDESINLVAPSGFLSYEWHLGSSSSPILGTDSTLTVMSPIAGTLYTVVMQPPVMPPATFACPIYLTTILSYSPPPMLPDYVVKTNVFTPDGDLENPTFDFNKFAYVKEFHIEVFNRWGKKVFETNDLTDKWDGKVNGKDADEGVYFWLASYTSSCKVDAEAIQNKGFVHLLRNK
jgi:gliding motility-associated-like protein